PQAYLAPFWPIRRAVQKSQYAYFAEQSSSSTSFCSKLGQQTGHLQTTTIPRPVHFRWHSCEPCLQLLHTKLRVRSELSIRITHFTGLFHYVADECATWCSSPLVIDAN